MVVRLLMMMENVGGVCHDGKTLILEEKAGKGGKVMCFQWGNRMDKNGRGFFTSGQELVSRNTHFCSGPLNV